jgi:hypothetical protein
MMCAAFLPAMIAGAGLSAQGTAALSKERNLANVASAANSMRYGPTMAVMNDGLTPTDTLPWRPRSNRGRQRPATAGNGPMG